MGPVGERILTGGSVGAGKKCWILDPRTLLLPLCFTLCVAAGQLLLARGEMPFFILPSPTTEVIRTMRAFCGVAATTETEAAHNFMLAPSCGAGRHPGQNHYQSWPSIAPPNPAPLLAADLYN